MLKSVLKEVWHSPVQAYRRRDGKPESSNDAEFLLNRINIDTGGFFSGVLTGLVIEDDSNMESARSISVKGKTLKGWE
jgi:hypothetical protein